MTRILVVDDEVGQLKLLAEILQREFPDYQILAAASLTEAKEKLAEVRVVSLVITDYKLTDGTGYELLRHCHEVMTNPSVIIITAYGEDENEEVRAALSFQKGACDFIEKPIIGLEKMKEMIERVRYALKISEALA